MAENPFRNRMFLDIKVKDSVKSRNVIDIFDKMRYHSLDLEDNDVVKICLLVLLELGFLDHQLSHNTIDETLMLVEHLSNYINIGGHPSYTCLYPQTVDGENSEGFGLEDILPFTSSRCHTLFISDKLAPPVKTLTPTKVESETSWWKASLEYFEGRHVQSEVVSEQLEIEKDGLSEQVQKKKKKREREGTVTTLTKTILSLQGTIGTLESRLLTLEGDARVFTLTHIVSSLQDDAHDFRVVSGGEIPAYMSPRPSYTLQGPSHTSLAPTAQKSLLLANWRKLRVRRTPLKFKSPMITYLRKFPRSTIPPPASTTTASVMTMLVPMMTTETGHTEEDLPFIRMEKSDKPNFNFLDLSKIKRKDKYPIYTIFENNKTECYLECLRKGMRCETTFWDILYPSGEKVDYIDQGKLNGYRPLNAQWTLGLSELVVFYIDSGKLMSMVSVVDEFRATIDGTNLLYLSWDKISQVTE
ncbi:hypothetical protein Tco_1078299 [Tanacetum coccineum]